MEGAASQCSYKEHVTFKWIDGDLSSLIVLYGGKKKLQFIQFTKNYFEYGIWANKFWIYERGLGWTKHSPLSAQIT